MIYALCFASNSLHCFRSEREAAVFCRRHGGDWQLCDSEGRALYPSGFTPRMHTGLLAAHLYLAEAHDSGQLQYGLDLGQIDLP